MSVFGLPSKLPKPLLDVYGALITASLPFCAIAVRGCNERFHDLHAYLRLLAQAPEAHREFNVRGTMLQTTKHVVYQRRRPGMMARPSYVCCQRAIIVREIIHHRGPKRRNTPPLPNTDQDERSLSVPTALRSDAGCHVREA
jgi:hypothetical protein